MPSPLALIGQAVVYALVAVALGALSDRPTWQAFPDDRAEIVLSFSHAGARKGGCRDMTAEEFDNLAPNMRPKGAQICPRERVPVVVAFAIDGDEIIAESLPPGGLAGDGPSRIYRRLALATGEHTLVAQLRDSDRAQGFDYTFERRISLAPRQRIVVDFRTDRGGFVIVGADVQGRNDP